jgi:N6-L-threonylcarbamoyladenine synthase
VNHLEGHIHAVLMDAGAAMEGPLLALVVSGGHTHLYLAEKTYLAGKTGARGWRYRNVGRTVDDAAGEAYDKVAKLLGLGYPGGPWIDRLAVHGNPRAVPFQFGKIKPRVYAEGAAPVNKKAGAARMGPVFDFSFSGIKTAVLRYVETHGMKPEIAARHAALAEIEDPTVADALPLCDAETLDLIASFQAAVVGNLARQAFGAAEAFGARGLVVSGGVAANAELRRRFVAEGERRGLPVAFPSLALSTDNAAMIAAAAWPKFVAEEFAGDGLVAVPQMKLG